MGIRSLSPRRAAFRAALWASAFLLLGVSSFAGDTFLLAGAGLGNLRYPPRQAYASLEMTHAFGSSPWGIWGTAEAGAHEAYLGVGLLFQWPLCERWVLGIGSGPGWYSNHRPLNLGSDLEFRSTAYLMYRMESGWRIGASVSHYSNAGLGTHNPGAESLRLFVAIPLGRR